LLSTSSRTLFWATDPSLFLGGEGHVTGSLLGGLDEDFMMLRRTRRKKHYSSS